MQSPPKRRSTRPTPTCNRAQADYARNKLDWDRAQNLFKEWLISKSISIAARTRGATADFRTGASQKLASLKPSSERFRRPACSPGARQSYPRLPMCLQKTHVLCSLRWRHHQFARAGRRIGSHCIQNALGSILMTLADMSVITAEVKSG